MFRLEGATCNPEKAILLSNSFCLVSSAVLGGDGLMQWINFRRMLSPSQPAEYSNIPRAGDGLKNAGQDRQKASNPLKKPPPNPNEYRVFLGPPGPSLTAHVAGKHQRDKYQEEETRNAILKSPNLA